MIGEYKFVGRDGIRENDFAAVENPLSRDEIRDFSLSIRKFPTCLGGKYTQGTISKKISERERERVREKNKKRQTRKEREYNRVQRNFRVAVRVYHVLRPIFLFVFFSSFPLHTTRRQIFQCVAGSPRTLTFYIWHKFHYTPIIICEYVHCKTPTLSLTAGLSITLVLSAFYDNRTIHKMIFGPLRNASMAHSPWPSVIMKSIFFFYFRVYSRYGEVLPSCYTDETDVKRVNVCGSQTPRSHCFLAV